MMRPLSVRALPVKLCLFAAWSTHGASALTRDAFLARQTRENRHSSSSFLISFDPEVLDALTPEAQAARLNASVQEAVAQHRAKPVHQGSRPIFWMHLHSHGGTFMCEAAAAQGENVPWSNCNFPGEFCSDVGGANHVSTCDKRSETDFTFRSIERTLQDDDVCDKELIGVMFRHPMAGMSSTLKANHFRKKRVRTILETKKITLDGAGHDGCVPGWDHYHHFDNFITRTLSGYYHLGPGEMTRKHLEQAKERIRQFDVVLILEELSHHQVQLKETLGWDLNMLNLTDRKNAHPTGTEFDEEETQFFERQNSLDMELYRFAQEVAAKLTRGQGGRDRVRPGLSAETVLMRTECPPPHGCKKETSTTKSPPPPSPWGMQPAPAYNAWGMQQPRSPWAFPQAAPSPWGGAAPAQWGNPGWMR